MREEVWNRFLNEHPTLEHMPSDTSDAILFRDPTKPWYQKEGNYTSITKEAFTKLETVEELEEAVYGRLNIEHITRVTGYFTKISQWNRGKKAELRDRIRSNI